MNKLETHEVEFLSELLYRFLNCLGCRNFYQFGLDDTFDNLLSKKIKEMSNSDIKEQVICVYINSSNYEEANRVIERYEDSNSIIVIGSEEYVHNGYGLSYINSNKKLKIIKNLLMPALDFKAPKHFNVLAIIHIYNEIDVIEQTVDYLLSQDIDVYLVDNWSVDGTYELIQKLSEKYPKKIFYERFPLEGKKDYYDWYHQLERTEEIAKMLDYNWYIHYDADEYRISPWDYLTLKDSIYFIDYKGYNLIENTVIDFKLTSMQNNSIFMKDEWFAFGHRIDHFQQTKTWKKDNSIELKSSGGHVAVIDSPKIYPLKILNRHYPFRTVEQAAKKIFKDRKPRFAKEKEEFGWHGHYDDIFNKSDLSTSTEGLILWNDETFKEYYIALFTGAGIKREKQDIYYKFIPDDYEVIKGCKVALYGAGCVGQFLYPKLDDICNVNVWVDRNYKRIPNMYGMNISNPQHLLEWDVDYIVVAIEDEKVVNKVVNELEQIGVDTEKIYWKQITHQ